MTELSPSEMVDPYKVIGEGAVILGYAEDQDWHARRSQYVTGSEVAALFEESPWQSRASLVSFKAQQTESLIKESRYMWWGSHRETCNAAAFEAITGACVFPIHAQIARGRVATTLDAVINGPALDREPLDWVVAAPKKLRQMVELMKCQMGPGVLELKNTGEYMGTPWKSGVPRHYWHQVQAQLYTTGLDWGIACAMVGADDMRAYLVEPDREHFRSLEAEVERFWAEVEEMKRDLEGF